MASVLLHEQTDGEAGPLEQLGLCAGEIPCPLQDPRVFLP
jgi:hypothetical protein